MLLSCKCMFAVLLRSASVINLGPWGSCGYSACFFKFGSSSLGVQLSVMGQEILIISENPASLQ